MKESVKEIVLPRRPPKNPVPSLSAGGDCGACAVAGVLGISVEQAYDYHVTGNYHGGDPIPKRTPWNKGSMKSTLTLLQNDLGGHRDTPVLVEHAVTEVPFWPMEPWEHQIAFGMTAYSQFYGWSSYVRAMLSGGYYGITTVFNNGYTGDLLHFGETDHWATIVGWRYAYEKNTDPERKCLGSYQQEILLANSANNSPLEQWIPIEEFLKTWGGFGAYWVKPK